MRLASRLRTRRSNSRLPHTYRRTTAPMSIKQVKSFCLLGFRPPPQGLLASGTVSVPCTVPMPPACQPARSSKCDENPNWQARDNEAALEKSRLLVTRAATSIFITAPASRPPTVADLDWRPKLTAVQEAASAAASVLLACLLYTCTAPATISVSYGAGVAALFASVWFTFRRCIIEHLYKVGCAGWTDNVALPMWPLCHKSGNS